MPNSVESLREQIAHETLAHALAAGKSLDEAARAAGLDVFEAAEAAQLPSVAGLIQVLAPDVARNLATSPAVPLDPLAVIESAMGTAAQTLVQAAKTPTGARIVLDLGAKLRASAQEAPTHVTVQLPEGRMKPLIAALDEFNSLLAALVAEDRKARSERTSA